VEFEDVFDGSGVLELGTLFCKLFFEFGEIIKNFEYIL
jgi:hypothetical protein